MHAQLSRFWAIRSHCALPQHTSSCHKSLVQALLGQGKHDEAESLKDTIREAEEAAVQQARETELSGLSEDAQHLSLDDSYVAPDSTSDGPEDELVPLSLRSPGLGVLLLALAALLVSIHFLSAPCHFLRG